MRKRNSTNSFKIRLFRSRMFFLLLLFISLSACSSRRNIIRIYFSGNLNGVIEDCRCPKVNYGSILNHLSFYRDSLNNRERTINICTGNIFSYNSADISNKIVSELLTDLKYDAAGVGRNDIFFIDQPDLPDFISLNIENAVKVKIIEFDGIKIAISGLTDPVNAKIMDGSKISDPTIEETKRSLDSLRLECDLMIFISNLESGYEKKLFNEISSIDIMISGTNQKAEEYIFGERIYLSPGNNGEHIGNICISTVNKGKYELRNNFTVINSTGFPESEHYRNILDSLKMKYGINLIRESIEQDL